MHSGPPDKWTDFNTEGLSSGEVLDKLNGLAKLGFTGTAVAVTCTDGTFVFVGGYGNNQQ